MMKKSNRFTAAFTAAAWLLMSLLPVPITAGAAGTPALPSANQAVRHESKASLSDAAAAYYTGAYSIDNLLTLQGAGNTSTSLAAMQNNALFTSLHTLMADTHIYYTSYSGYKAGSLAYYWNATDANAGSADFIAFYSDIPYYYNNAQDKAFDMEREHIWPKSRASFQQLNGGSDLHHLRPSVSEVNQAKSDHAFGNVNGIYQSGTAEVVFRDTVYGWTNAQQDLFECKDDVKGDAARILLYVYCRWEQPNLYSDVAKASLPLLDEDDKSNNGKRVIESLDTLLQWMAEDPVDEWEMQRNDKVQAVQGNRNVFIDHPELAWKLFGMEVPAGLQTPSEPDGHTTGQLPGDVNGDKAVNAMDATDILKAAARYGTVSSYGLTEAQMKAADVNDDGQINAKDATAILRYAAFVGNGGKGTLTDFI